MRGISWIFVLLLATASAEARQSPQAPKRIELGGSVGWYLGNPGESDSPYGDEWFGAGRYAAQIGYYWTEHIKTEVEYAHTGEGELYSLAYRRMPDGGTHSYRVDSRHQVQQLAVRMSYQFGSNRWVHPYVNGGVFGERDAIRTHADESIYYGIGNRNTRIPAFNSGPIYDDNLGFTVGAGTKIYVSQNAFLNTGMIGTWTTTPVTRSFTLHIGFGIDF